MAVTRISDIIVPSVFTPYAQQETETKSRIVRAGVLARDPQLDMLLAGGGLTFNVPSFKDLDDDTENVSSDDPSSTSTPNEIGTAQEVGVRLSRNQSWGSAALAATLAGADPMGAIAGRVSSYWAIRLQRAFLATAAGLFADNDAAPSGSEHTAGDLTYDIKGAAYSEGVTTFSAEAFIDAAATMGDSQEDLGIVVMHSVVYARARKNNLIDYIQDSSNPLAAAIPTFLGRIVVVDDMAPVTSGVYQTLLFGAGSFRLGVGTPDMATEVDRTPAAGNGAGIETLYNRVEWMIHPVGHKYAGTSPNGGPSNAATSNNLAHADSWQRVFPQRKQIKIARLITRES